VIDHVNALACGGADAPSNMQWQTVSAGKAKDRWERTGCSNGTRHPVAANVTDKPGCLTGPRGGRYQMIAGRKRYGC